MKVGDYVRLDRCQGINRIEGITIDYVELEQYVADEYGEATMILRKNDIIKSSPNIIDLIEVGDLVTLTSKYCENEVYRVMHTFKDNNDTIIELDCFQDGTMFISKLEDIKSIVTREMFESMEYKV